MVMLDQRLSECLSRTADERLSGARQIVEAVMCRLQKCGYPALGTIRVDFHEGVLVLRGHLPSYYLKQVAQTVVARVEGVQQVDNRVQVCDTPSKLPR